MNLAFQANGSVMFNGGILTINSEEGNDVFVSMIGEIEGNEPSALPQEIKCEEGVTYSLQNYRRLRIVHMNKNIVSAYLLK